jgi:DNA-binding XRE family transcriptional regulator
MNTEHQVPAPNIEPKKCARDAMSLSRPQTIAPEQLRAARSLLDWTRNDLAKTAGLSPETIKNIEHGIFTPQKQTILALVETFARHGVQFVHYETLIASPTGSEPVGQLQAISYVGVVRTTASVPEIKEEDNG